MTHNEFEQSWRIKILKFDSVSPKFKVQPGKILRPERHTEFNIKKHHIMCRWVQTGALKIKLKHYPQVESESVGGH